jgi:NADH:ubiquinone oxidoreductase subunit E
VFNVTNLNRAREIIGRYPDSRSALLPLLHLAQDQDGWVTPEAMEEIAELLAITTAEVLGTCSFYTMFKREPVGKLVVSVCTNVTCLVLGGPEILHQLEHRYADDPDVTVEEVECLAGCGGAPCMQVNYEFHEHLTAGEAQSIVAKYMSGEFEARTISGSLLTRTHGA